MYRPDSVNRWPGGNKRIQLAELYSYALILTVEASTQDNLAATKVISLYKSS